MKNIVSTYWRKIESSLFPGFAEDLGPTTEKHLKVILILDTEMLYTVFFAARIRTSLQKFFRTAECLKKFLFMEIA